LASVWSTINANPARKGAKNRSFVREREKKKKMLISFSTSARTQKSR
jgi:hypothetical protein